MSGTVPLNTQVIACTYTDVTGGGLPRAGDGLHNGRPGIRFVERDGYHLLRGRYRAPRSVRADRLYLFLWRRHCGRAHVRLHVRGSTLPGVYELIVGAQSPGECTNADTLLVLVGDTAPIVEGPLLLPFCAREWSITGRAAGRCADRGSWSGPGVANGSWTRVPSVRDRSRSPIPRASPSSAAPASADVEIQVYDTVLVFAGLGDLLFCSDRCERPIPARNRKEAHGQRRSGSMASSIGLCAGGQLRAPVHLDRPGRLYARQRLNRSSWPTRWCLRCFLNGTPAESGTLCPTDFPAVFTATPAFGSWGGTVPTSNDTLIIEV